MKVLFISSGNSKFGIGSIVKAQGESLKPYVCLDYFTITGKGISGYLKNIPKLKNYLRQNEVDIIHAHYGLSGWVAFFAKKHQKLIVSYMGDDLIGSKGENGKTLLYSRIIRFLNKVLARFFNDFTIVKSKFLAKNLFGSTLFEIIPNGVNMKIFTEKEKSVCREKLNIISNQKIILFLSDPKRSEKNFLLAKQAFEMMLSQKIKLITVFGLHQNILPLYYNSADMLLLTSLHEGSPNVIKEAMACNIPIVSTDVGDVTEIIGKTKGCYITSFNPEDVAGKIKKALEFGQRTTGRQDIRHLESSMIAKKIIKIYKQVLN